MMLSKPTLGKHTWSLMTPGYLFVGLEPKYLYSAPYADKGTNYFARLSISTRLNLKTGKLDILLAPDEVAKSEIWAWIRQETPEFKGERQGLYSLLTKADPLTRKVLTVVRKHLVSEKYPKGTILTEHIKLPKGILQRKGDILYFGYKGKVTQVHSLDKVHRLVRDAISAGNRVWGWSPNNLKVFSHSSGNAMGLAYQPGKGAHAISLHTKLLREYDQDSIYRVLLHELCHHHREEAWPRKSITKANAHDEVFCGELSKVDPIVAESGNCRYFREEQWLQSAALVQKKKREKAISYKPKDGYLVLRRVKGGSMRLDWLPEEKGAFRKKVYVVSYESLKKLLSNFTLDQIQKVMVINQTPEHSSFRKSLGDTTTLAQFMNLLTAVFPSHNFERLREALK